MKRTILIILFIALVSGGAYWWTQRQAGPEKPTYTTKPVARGDVRSKVTATGTLQAAAEARLACKPLPRSWWGARSPATSNNFMWDTIPK